MVSSNKFYQGIQEMWRRSKARVWVWDDDEESCCVKKRKCITQHAQHNTSKITCGVKWAKRERRTRTRGRKKPREIYILKLCRHQFLTLLCCLSVFVWSQANKLDLDTVLEHHMKLLRVCLFCTIPYRHQYHHPSCFCTRYPSFFANTPTCNLSSTGKSQHLLRDTVYAQSLGK